MAENRPGHDEELDRPNEGFETQDVNAWALTKFAIALVLLCVGAMALLMGVFHYYITADRTVPPRVTEHVATDASKQPPAPQLEQTPILDLQRERAAEDRILSSYSWVDKQNGIVRIPIDKAIDLLVQKGLPVRTQAPAADTVTVPLESGLGPVMQQVGGPLGSAK
jgi:hypothetical protein